MSARRRPRIALLGTGGTIAGAGAPPGPEAPSPLGAGGYQAAVFGIEHIAASVPGLSALAELLPEQLFQIDSAALTDAHLLRLAQRVNALAAQPDVDGIVITHGTDTLEESAYFLHLSAKTRKPVVLTGAMRPATALAADGPANLLHAVRVAAHPDSAGRGALVVFNEQIHSGRDLRKTHTQRLDAFTSAWGPLGLLAPDGPRWYRSPSRSHTAHTAFDTQALRELPPVGLLAGHSHMRPEIVHAWAAAGARALIYAGPGAGTVPDYLRPAFDSLRQQGIWLVRASRTGQGPLTHTPQDQAQGWLAVDDQPPPQARLLTALALAHGLSPQQTQALFAQY